MEKMMMTLKSDSFEETDIDLTSFLLGYMAGVEFGKSYERDRKQKRRFKNLLRFFMGQPREFEDV